MRYLRTKEAADYTGLSPSWLEKARLNGDGPPYIQVGRGHAVLYAAEELDGWLAQFRRRSTADLTAPQRQPDRKRRA